MNIKQAKKLFKKYTNNECSLEEIQLLDTFLDSYQDKNNTWPELKVGKEEAFKKHSWKRIEFQINKSQKRYPFSPYLKYVAAASVLLLVALTLFFNKEDNSQPVEPTIVNTIIKPGTDKATLTLGDGSQIILEKGTSFKTQSANSNGEEIIYTAEQESTKEVTYNYLTIPRGGQFYIKLSDGTQVWLNSESQLKYPVSFLKGETRKVELVYGEAYFDVSPSNEHGGSKFKVLNQNQEIEVFGTEFNIKAYKDESIIYTTLVEGKVRVSISDSKQNLIPNQQTKVDLNNNEITVNTVDVYNEISWKDGIFSFEKKPLIEIMKVLSRWYDTEVVFNNESLKEVKFYGVLGKEQSIEEILETIKKFKIIENYEIKDKVIILK